MTSEEAARRTLRRARPSVDAVLSLWPADRRTGIVLWVKVGDDGNVDIVAHPREEAVLGATPEVVRDLRRIRDDVPVEHDRRDEGTLVVPLRALREPR